MCYLVIGYLLKYILLPAQTYVPSVFTPPLSYGKANVTLANTARVG